MRAEGIFVRPFVELTIEEYESIQEINEHASVRLKGQIPSGKKDEYMQKCWESGWVQVIVVSEKTEHVLFCGIMVGATINVIGDTCSMELNLQSGTVLMDEKKRIRSFQTKKITYGEVLEICNQDYENVEVNCTFEKEQEIKHFIMQYMETDWEFIKRMASLKHLMVMPECFESGVKYNLGIPEREEISPFEQIEFQIVCDMEEYRKKTKAGMNITLSDESSYAWKSREIYKPGCWCKIKGQPHYIWKIESKMTGGELYHTYYMRLKTGLMQQIKYNTNLSGATLFGVVTGVRNDTVQMKMADDENKGQTELRWFPYASIYSSANGSGWYCMPEIGDKVRLYFPSFKDQEAFVVSAYHEAGSKLRQNPERKFWRNKEGKEIQLAPGKILLTNNNGTYIELSDAEGVKIVSDGPVSLSAGGMLRLFSTNSSIELSAPNKIKLKQGDTVMNLGGDLSMSGAQIKL